MLHKIKTFIRNIFSSDNLFGFYCPNCEKDFESPTAWFHKMWDEKHRCYKKYIKCDSCSRTTPAYKNKVDAVRQWEDQWEIAQDPDDMLNKN